MYHFAQPICCLCNLFWREGIFELSAANLGRLYKPDDFMAFDYYYPYPYCVPHQRSWRRLYRRYFYIFPTNILYGLQFRFWKDCFFNMALLTLMDKLTSALENGELMVWVFWDFSKVCETTNHHIYLINYITIVYVELHFHGSTILYLIDISFFYI